MTKLGGDYECVDLTLESLSLTLTIIKKEKPIFFRFCFPKLTMYSKANLDSDQFYMNETSL
jgi:hypothetical protein